MLTEKDLVLVNWTTEEHKAEAFSVGEERLNLARQLDRTQPYGNPGDENRLEIDQWSSLSEKVTAQYLNLPWHKEILRNLYPKPSDVGNNIDVKWTGNLPGHLILHEEDLDDRAFVLVRGKLPNMVICGWTMGFAGKKEEYQNNKKARSASDYWIPVMSDLFPLWSLVEAINEELVN